eukprot:1150320-Pelagomonas_calceolata.AAC.4
MICHYATLCSIFLWILSLLARFRANKRSSGQARGSIATSPKREGFPDFLEIHVRKWLPVWTCEVQVNVAFTICTG